MESSGTDESLSESIHDAVAAAIVCASIPADLVGRFLQGTEQGPSEGFSAAFLLELGAALQLLSWKRDGLDELADLDLPTDAEAETMSVVDAAARSQGGEAPTSFSVARAVFTTWLTRFSWDAAIESNASVAICDVDENELVHAIAELLWDNRHAS